ncbi:MAG: hypothetical protein ACI81Y_001127, partial [Glaciecola sp.]
EKISEKDLKMLSESIKIDHAITVTRKNKNLSVWMNPIRIGSNGGIELLQSVNLRVTEIIGAQAAEKKSGFSFVDHSKLSSGDWFKISISQSGVYKISKDFLSGLGLNTSNLNPDQINIYGNGGQMLPLENSVPRADDLEINAIQIIGDDDGSFDSNDFILFYAKGPNTWLPDADGTTFTHEKHRYSNKSYYYIGVGVDPPKRIEIQAEIAEEETHTVDTFNAYAYHEVDDVNLTLSGRDLYGEKFDFVTSYNFNNSDFTFSNIDQNSPVEVKVRLINVTESPNSGEYQISCNNQSKNFTIVGHGTGTYADNGVPKIETINPFNPTSDNLSVSIEFQKDFASEEAYLDYIEINARRQMVMSGSQLSFRDLNSVGTDNIARFNMSNAGSLYKFWDVSDHLNVSEIIIEGDGNLRSFKTQTDNLKEFVAFKNSGYPSPTSIGAVQNQDLHGLEQQDMIILAAPMFVDQANDLADFHREEGLLVSVVTPMEIYNEFSSGNPDITAIKGFCKMFYDRSTSESDLLDYLLFIGDASYKNNNIDPLSSPLLLCYQNEESLDPLYSFVTDDYFGFLDDNEGEGDSNTVDIGIGRFPVNNVEQLGDVIRKIKLYASNNSSPLNSDCFSNESNVFGDWRTKMLFIADDENTVTHISDANIMAEIVNDNYKEYNINKIYIDAYQQVTTTGGERYPLAEKDLRENIERGAQIVTYFGHGGEVGWAHERILDIPTINNFTNLYRLPVFLTATCEFSRFDDPNRTSAGELLLLNPNGGAVALLSTSRPVFANANEALAKAFFNLALEKDATNISYGSSGENVLNHGLRLGDICRVTKNGIPASTNKRNFTLLGDPALSMSYPKYYVEQDQITDEEGNILTEIKALQQVTVSGHIEDENGSLISTYNGFVTPTVFDKPKNLETLQNDNGSGSFSFELQTNVLYKGNTTVENGTFSFTFIVPKDISYQEGNGRISYYALGDESDAFGYNFNSDSDQSFVITGQNDNAPEDEVGPVISLFLDNENFVEGGITNESPVLIAQFEDEHGINTSSSGIGHDITLIIDEDSQNTILLNELYQSDLDTYQSGSIRYPIKDMTTGEHTLTVKVWDIYNNSSKKTITFEVANSTSLALENVLNYPNPFTTHTEFMFQHNQNCNSLDVDIQIFTVSGKLVKTIQNTLIPQHEGSNESISWNGRDDYGDKLGRGVYVYKLKVKTPSGLKEEVFEKLVILN